MRSMRKYLIAIAVLLLAFSCSRTIDHQLDTIEQEISSDPYAAYEQLSDIPQEQLRPSSRKARYALLMSLAMDKSYIDVADDSLAQIAVRYFDRHGTKRDKMLSLYSLGRVQRNAGNNTGAIISFLQAKEMAVKMEDLHYTGLILRNMAEIYGDCQDYDTELAYYQESARFFHANDEPYYAAYAELGESMSYISLGEMQVADSILAHLESYARKEDKKEFLSKILKDRAYILTTQNGNNSEETITLFREAAWLGFPAATTADYCLMARAFDSNLQRQIDSADYYLLLAERAAKTLLDSIHLCNARVFIYERRNCADLAFEQMNKGIELHNKMVFSKENQQTANTVRDYREQEATHHAVLARYRFILLVLSALVIIALFCVLVLYIILHRRQLAEKERALQEQEEQLEEDLLQIREITDSLLATRQDCSELAYAVNLALQEKITVVKMFADTYAALLDDSTGKTSDPYRYLDEDYQKRKDIRLQSFVSALDALRKDDSLFLLLEDSINKFRDNLMARFRAACNSGDKGRPLFNESDYRMIMLFFAGIPDRTVAFLMQMTCGAVRTRKTRFKERISRNLGQNGDNYIRALSGEAPEIWM